MMNGTTTTRRTRGGSACAPKTLRDTKNVRGFTLVETLVAIAVLMIAIVGPFYALENALTASYTARDQLTASMLAQEGLEYVRGIRDENALRNMQAPGSRNWLSSLDGTPGGTVTYANCVAPHACTVDPGQNKVAACTGTCSSLFVSTNNIYNQQTSGAPSPFTRSIQITSIANSGAVREAQITVTVSWTYHGTHSVTISQNIQQWI